MTAPAASLPSETTDASLLERVAEGSAEALAALYDRHAAPSTRSLRGRPATLRSRPTSSRRPSCRCGIGRNCSIQRAGPCGDGCSRLPAIGRSIMSGMPNATTGPSRFHARNRRQRRRLPRRVADGVGRTRCDGCSRSEPGNHGGRPRGARHDGRGDRIPPPVERSVITLAYGAHLSQVEIAARLGWPIGTVKTRTRRALRHLRERMAPP